MRVSTLSPSRRILFGLLLIAVLAVAGWALTAEGRATSRFTNCGSHTFWNFTPTINPGGAGQFSADGAGYCTRADDPTKSVDVHYTIAGSYLVTTCPSTPRFWGTITIAPDDGSPGERYDFEESTLYPGDTTIHDSSVGRLRWTYTPYPRSWCEDNSRADVQGTLTFVPDSRVGTASTVDDAAVQTALAPITGGEPAPSDPPESTADPNTSDGDGPSMAQPLECGEDGHYVETHPTWAGDPTSGVSQAGNTPQLALTQFLTLLTGMGMPVEGKDFQLVESRPGYARFAAVDPVGTQVASAEVEQEGGVVWHVTGMAACTS